MVGAGMDKQAKTSYVEEELVQKSNLLEELSAVRSQLEEELARKTDELTSAQVIFVVVHL